MQDVAVGPDIFVEGGTESGPRTLGNARFRKLIVLQRHCYIFH